MASKMTARREEIMARFGGMGFHNSEAGQYRKMSDRQFNEVVGKNYHKLPPGFLQIGGVTPTKNKPEMNYIS